MDMEKQVIAFDPAYRIRDNQLWYTDCSFANLIRDKESIEMDIEGLGVRTLTHSARGGTTGQTTTSYKLPYSEDIQWWIAHRGKHVRLELLSIQAETE